MQIPDDFIERCVETFQNRDDLVALLEKGGPLKEIKRILSEEVTKTLSYPPTPQMVEETQVKFALLARFDAMSE